jgi:hypothetical protein
MPAPNIQIIFKQQGITAIKRGQRGIVALILKDATHNGLISMSTIKDIPTDLSAGNKAQLQFAFVGGVNPPIKVLAYIEPSAATDYTEAMNVLETVKWNYLAVPGISSADATIVSSWIKSLRDTKDIKVKAILPNTSGDHEGIINFATDNIVVGEATYAAKDYCSRIAGLLAGTPLDMSATYSVLSEVNDVPHLAISDFDTAVDAGKLVLINDGVKVKIVRAVNSLVTTTPDKGSDFKKIKMVDIMDQIHDDIKSTISDSYVGKVPNDYDHKCLLIAALRAYCESLESLELLDKGKSVIDIDIDAQTIYLKSVGTDVSKMTNQQIKEANTADQVFIGGDVKILDAMEDFNFNITL